MNFVFDIGNVLVNFKPIPFLREQLHDPALEAAMNKAVFQSPEWARLDEGSITQEDACAAICARAPEHRALIGEIMARLPELLTPMPETVALLPKVKAAGHGLYFLSNYHTKLSRYIRAKYAFFGLFDGGVFSCDVHLCKPSPAIYRCFLGKYRLPAESCLFFDDMPENVGAANGAGMEGVLFRDVQDVAARLL